MLFNGEDLTVGFHFNEIETRGDDIIQIFLDKLRFTVAGIIKNFMNQSFNAIDIFNHHFAESVNEFSIIPTSRSELHERLNGSQRVSNFMCKATRYGFQRPKTVC